MTMGNAVERVTDNGRELAIILPAGFQKDGIEFFSKPDYSQQLAYMNRPAGYRIAPHVHNRVERQVAFTLEALFVKSGKVRLDLYSQERTLVASRVLTAGDIVLLTSGGHGFEMLEPTEMIEVKQGPYAGDMDKERF
jgi:hypothetical protein